MLKNALNDSANWQTRKLSNFIKVSHPCLDDHLFKQEELEICGRIVTSVLTDCLEMLLLGTNWLT